MGREVTVRQMQSVVADLHAYVESDLCPCWAREMVKAMADILEQFLIHRDEE